MGKLLGLLKKNQRTLHVYTFESMIAFLFKYGEQFGAQAPQILEEVAAFINENDLELVGMALSTSSLCFNIMQSASPQANRVIEGSVVLANSTLISGKALDELHKFFSVATAK